MKSVRSSESGQAVLLMVVLCTTVLLGFAGLAADVGTLFQAKRLVQTVADSAAIAGASQLLYSGVTSAARTDANLNGMTNGANGATVAVNNPPLSGPHAGNPSYVEIIASQSSPTFFMKIFRFNSVTVSARAVATLRPGQGCIVTLGTSGTDISANGVVTAPDCDISANSTSSNAMDVTGSSATITASSIGVVGGFNGSITPTPTTGVAPVNDPLGYLNPPSGTSCPGGLTYAGTATVSPGLYCSGISIGSNQNVTFSSGIYLLSGNGLSIGDNSTVTGTGVTLYFFGNSSTISAPSTTTLNLTAQTSGPYNGILFYQDRSDSASASFGGTSGGMIEGVAYFPDASLSFQGNSTGTFYVALVAQSVSLGGNATLLNYASLNGSSPITAVTLVE
ncbi:MAG: pilus assembly protein TadG-related protein [Acidobacteriota bacterium]|nr:pilus assembly protein TadG-related protein [Acidobacteriota bacterium]